MKYIIRPGRIEDSSMIHHLFKELAEVEETPNAVDLTVEELKRTGFGEDPIMSCLVAEYFSDNEAENGVVIGCTVFSRIFKAFEGLYGYLDTITITVEHRGKGLGKALMQATAKACIKAGCVGMIWAVVGWNEPAVRLYENIGGENKSKTHEWEIFKLNETKLKALATEKVKRREGIEVKVNM